MDNQDNLKISIIVRTKNRASLLKEGLESIVTSCSAINMKDQKYVFAEIIVVNDGGVCVAEVVHGVLAGKMDYKYLNLENGVGRSAAGNMGVRACCAPWVFFLDDDDLLIQDGIKGFFAILGNAKSFHKETLKESIVYHGKVKALRYNPEGSFEKPFKVFTTPFNADAMLWENHIPINSLIIPRSLFLEIGGFDPSFSCFEDWDLLLRLSDIAEFVFLPFFMAIYRIFDHSFIVGGGGEEWQEQGREKFYRKHWYRYTPDKMVRIYKAVSKEMRGEFLPEMTLLREKIEDFDQERMVWTSMDHDRAAYIMKLESDIRNLEQDTRKCQFDWATMDKEREIYIRKLESDIRKLESDIRNLESDIRNLESDTRKRQLDWEVMDKERGEYVNDLLRHIQNLESDTRKRQLDWEVMNKDREKYVCDLLMHIRNLETRLGAQERE